MPGTSQVQGIAVRHTNKTFTSRKWSFHLKNITEAHAYIHTWHITGTKDWSNRGTNKTSTSRQVILSTRKHYRSTYIHTYIHTHITKRKKTLELQRESHSADDRGVKRKFCIQENFTKLAAEMRTLEFTSHGKKDEHRHLLRWNSNNGRR